MKPVTLLTIIVALWFMHSCRKNAVNAVSPDGTISITLEAGPGGLLYSVGHGDEVVVRPSPLRLEFEGLQPFGIQPQIRLISESEADVTWEPLWGKTGEARNHYREYIYRVTEKTGDRLSLELHFRLFNNGVAFRYVFPGEFVPESFRLTDELTGFNIDPACRIWATNHGGYYTSQEHLYDERMAGEIAPEELIGCPVLVETGQGSWLLLTEADLTDWAGLYFRSGTEGSSTLISSLAPLKRDPAIRVEGKAPMVSPWRVIMVGDDPGDLVESNMIANLNDPAEFEDVSWIRPGISAWDRWWSGDYGPDAGFKLGMNTPTMKYYIDLAGAMEWEYMIVDWTWYGNVFVQQGDRQVPDPAADITIPIDAVDIQEIISYAAERNVGIILWVLSDHLDRQMDEALALYEQWGAKGIKVDFMDCDDQDMVNWYHRVARKAAEHHLVVDFHGAYKPTGVSRTLPNMLTREGVLGNEYTKWSDMVTPRHTVTLPFTRGLLGEMDFTPGGFNHIHQEDFVIVGSDAPNPYVMGTRCHQLAMTVVYESAFTVMCDSPFNYRDQPGSDFLKLVPSSWSETRFLGGYPGDYVLLARRNGEQWFIGGMTNEDPREVSFELDFLDPGTYRATIWKDAPDSGDFPANLEKSVGPVSDRETLSIHMERGGGFVLVLEPAV
jgi:alpha-glucosidase